MSESLELLLIMVAVSSPILLIVFIVTYFRYKAKVNDRLATIKQQVDTQATEELRREVDQLKERTRVLEEIVTDGKYELLRDFQSIQD